MRRLAFLLPVLFVLSAAVAYVSGKLDRPGRTGRLYGLLTFGPEGKLRAWVAVDGNAVYLDRDGDGEFTRADERFARAGGLKDVTLTDPDGKTSYEITRVSVRDGELPDGEPTRSLMVDVAIRGPLSYRQYGDLVLAPSREKAPVAHFHGPLTARPREVYWKLPPELKLVTGDEPTDLQACVGTFSEERGCWVVVRTHDGDRCEFPDGVRPTVEVEFPSKAPGGPAVRRKYTLDGFC